MTPEYKAAYAETFLPELLAYNDILDGMMEWSLRGTTGASAIYTTPGALTDSQWERMGQPELIVGRTLAEIAAIAGLGVSVYVEDRLRRIGPVTVQTNEALSAARAAGGSWPACADWWIRQKSG